MFEHYTNSVKQPPSIEKLKMEKVDTGTQTQAFKPVNLV